jgi:hypothetical protein
MVFSASAAAARRSIAVMAAHKTPPVQQWQRRAMAAGPAPEWQGIDKVVRGVFPHDHQRMFRLFEIPNSRLFWVTLTLGPSFFFSRYGNFGWIFRSICFVQDHECHKQAQATE